MRDILKNRILKQGILGFFVLLLLLLPLSFSLVSENSYVQIALEKNVISAQSNPLTFIAEKSINGAINIVGNTFLSVCSFFTWVGGLFLEKSLQLTVFEMGSKFAKGSQLSTTIDTVWKLIRDICNLAFIFGFIFVGIRTIIDSDSASTKRFLSRIIIGALLINFSLFFTKAIIDFSNFTAVQVYSSMTSGNGSISANVAQQLGLVTLYDDKDGTILKGMTSNKSFSFFIMGGLFLLITAFTFFAAALLLIVRFVVLLFIMIASPVLFAATVFPQTEHFALDLWKKLISYSFFAPAYLLLTLISLKMIEGLGLKGSGFASELSGASNNFASLLNFTIIIFFMIASLMIASKMGVAGGNMAISVGNSIRGKAQSAIGRNTLGWGSHKLLGAYEKFDARTKDSKTKRWIGRAANVATFGIAGGVVNDRNIREGLKAGEHAKFGGSLSYEDDEKYDKERKARQGRTTEMDSLEAVLRKSQAPGAMPDDLIKMERSVSSASNEQILNLLREFKEDSNEYKAAVANITSSQFEALMKLKEDELDDAQKGKLGSVRAEAVERRLIANMPGAVNISDVIGKADSKEDLNALSYQTLSDNAQFLTTKQIADVPKLTPTSRAQLKDKRKQDLEALAQIPGGMQTIFTSRFKEDEIAKLPDAILTNPAAAPFLNSNILSKILDNDGITAPTRNLIKGNVLRVHGNAAFNNFFSTPRGILF